jgi:hypothetical protein
MGNVPQHRASGVWVKIAASVLSVVLIAGWIDLSLGVVSLSFYIMWAIVATITVAVCVFIGQINRGPQAMLFWTACLLVSLMLCGFSILAFASIGLLTAPIGIVLVAFSSVSLVAGLHSRR